jgi:hypothetical protein
MCASRRQLNDAGIGLHRVSIIILVYWLARLACTCAIAVAKPEEQKHTRPFPALWSWQPPLPGLRVVDRPVSCMAGMWHPGEHPWRPSTPSRLAFATPNLRRVRPRASDPSAARLLPTLLLSISMCTQDTLHRAVACSTHRLSVD